MTETAYVNAVVAAAQARGVTDPEMLARIRDEARDVYESCLATFSGRPSGSTASN